MTGSYGSSAYDLDPTSMRMALVHDLRGRFSQQQRARFLDTPDCIGAHVQVADSDGAPHRHVLGVARIACREGVATWAIADFCTDEQPPRLASVARIPDIYSQEPVSEADAAADQMIDNLLASATFSDRATSEAALLLSGVLSVYSSSERALN